MAKKSKEEEIRQQNVAEAVSKTEEFFKKNGNIIYGCVIAVLVIALGALAYTRFYLQPKRAEAQKEMFHAEQWFADGEYELSLNGDGNYLGLLDIIDQYGSKAGKSVYLYTGIAKLQMGEFEDAISYLKKYNGKDKILLARAQCCIGDAYVGLEDAETALGWFEKAAKTSDNAFSAAYLLKEGIAAESLGKNELALGCYKKIKDQYPQAPEAMDIDKYISKIENAQ
ncbi:MAG: hypothetical protein II465_00010 [Bacteroidales bacterium]|nr:hypothetical protein [Bacteroidales bacterium]